MAEFTGYEVRTRRGDWAPLKYNKNGVFYYKNFTGCGSVENFTHMIRFPGLDGMEGALRSLKSFYEYDPPEFRALRNVTKDVTKDVAKSVTEKPEPKPVETEPVAEPVTDGATDDDEGADDGWW